MDFELFKPAAMAAVFVFVLWSFPCVWVFPRRMDKVWGMLIGAFVSVLVYSFIVVRVFEAHGVNYLPWFLWELFR